MRERERERERERMKEIKIERVIGQKQDRLNVWSWLPIGSHK